MTKEDIIQLNRETIIKMAREADATEIGHKPRAFHFYIANLERFAKLVAEHEREACAKLVEVSDDLADWEIICGSDGRVLLNAMADEIRARGQI